VEGSGCGLILDICLQGLRKTTKTVSQDCRWTGEIRTWNLPNINEKRYRSSQHARSVCVLNKLQAETTVPAEWATSSSAAGRQVPTKSGTFPCGLHQNGINYIWAQGMSVCEVAGYGLHNRDLILSVVMLALRPRPTLGPNEPCIHWGQVPFLLSKVCRNVKLTTHIHLVPR
jgi:hypothetical protein